MAAAAHLASLADYADLDGHLLLADDPFVGLDLDAQVLVLHAIGQNLDRVLNGWLDGREAGGCLLPP